MTKLIGKGKPVKANPQKNSKPPAESPEAKGKAAPRRIINKPQSLEDVRAAKDAERRQFKEKREAERKALEAEKQARIQAMLKAVADRVKGTGGHNPPPVIKSSVRQGMPYSEQFGHKKEGAKPSKTKLPPPDPAAEKKAKERHLPKRARLKKIKYGFVKRHAAEAQLEKLKEGKAPLKDRSNECWSWIEKLEGKAKTKAFENSVAIDFSALRRIKRQRRLNKGQCTELFNLFLTSCLFAKAPKNFLKEGKKNYCYGAGWNNAWGRKRWTAKSMDFVNKLIKDLNALGWIAYQALTKKSYKDRLPFAAINRFSAELSASARKLIKARAPPQFHCWI